MTYVNSYEFQNTVRDLGDAFRAIVVNDPILLNFLNESGFATNTKHEWLEDVITAKSWATDAAYTVADGTFTLVSTVWVKAGDILGFKKASGASSTLQVKVVSVDSATAITVSVYGWTTDENLASGTTVSLISRPKNESSVAEADNGGEPSVQYNYTQIFDRTAKVSKTAQSVKMYGLDNALNYEVSRQLADLRYELVNAIIFGRRVQRNGSEAGTMWGMLHFMEIANTAGADNKINASAAALSSTILNNGYEKGYKNGATNLTTVLCGPKQARKISAFNTSGANPVIMKSESSTQAGAYVSAFVADLPVQGWMVGTILVVSNFPEDKILLLDNDRVNFMPLQGRSFTDSDATPQGADFFARRILGEYTLEFKNAGNAHILIENLAI